MIPKAIEFTYISGTHEQFDVSYSGTEFTLESNDLKITMNRERFEELREKINRLYEEVN